MESRHTHPPGASKEPHILILCHLTLTCSPTFRNHRGLASAKLEINEEWRGQATAMLMRGQDLQQEYAFRLGLSLWLDSRKLQIRPIDSSPSLPSNRRP